MKKLQKTRQMQHNLPDDKNTLFLNQTLAFTFALNFVAQLA
jgi:hypothetical protein